MRQQRKSRPISDASGFKHVFDPEFVNFFREWEIVDSRGRSLFEITPRTNRGNPIDNMDAPHYNPLNDKRSPERKERVELLTALYAECEKVDVNDDERVSPFDC